MQRIQIPDHLLELINEYASIPSKTFSIVLDKDEYDEEELVDKLIEMGLLPDK